MSQETTNLLNNDTKSGLPQNIEDGAKAFREINEQLDAAQPMIRSMPPELAQELIETMSPDAQRMLYARIFSQITMGMASSLIRIAAMSDDEADQLESQLVEFVSKMEENLNSGELREGLIIAARVAGFDHPDEDMDFGQKFSHFKNRLALFQIRQRETARTLYLEIFGEEMPEDLAEKINL